MLTGWIRLGFPHSEMRAQEGAALLRRIAGTETGSGPRVDRRSGPQREHRPQGFHQPHSCPLPFRSYTETLVSGSPPTIPTQPPAPLLLPSLGVRAHYPPPQGPTP